MINLSFETLVIIVLIAFIIGVLIGVDRGKPTQYRNLNVKEGGRSLAPETALPPGSSSLRRVTFGELDLCRNLFVFVRATTSR